MEIQEIERAIIKKYRKQVWIPFIEGINEFNLIEEGDKIAVCISGGKDSFLLAKLLQELKKHGKRKFQLEFISMDPGFNKENRTTLVHNCEKLNIPVKIFDSDIFSVAQKISAENPCYLCARMRRGFLYNKAQELGCNKIALGHHMDDVIETTMLNLLYSGNFKTMMPRLKSTNFDNMELIRPMFHIKEDGIVKFANFTELNFMQCGCEVIACRISSKRNDMKRLIWKMKKENPDVDKSIMRAAYNVNLDAVIGFKSRGTRYDFMDFYDDDYVLKK